jgi:hypothetical protein
MPSSFASAAVRKTVEVDIIYSIGPATVRGLLAICWQSKQRHGPKRVFVLVGVTGIEPVTSAV